MNRKTTVSLMLLLVLMLTLFSGCQSTPTATPNDPTPEQPEATLLTILGFNDGSELTYTLTDLQNLEPTETDITGTSSSGEEKTVKVKGASLAQLLDTKAVDLYSLQGVRLIASDDYSIEVPAEVIANTDIILGYEEDATPLTAENGGPLRSYVNGQRTMYWARNLAKVELIMARQNSNVSKLIVLENAWESLDKTDYTYYENVDQAIKLADLLTDTSAESFTLTADDGFEKIETADVVMSAYLKVNGDNAPLFFSPDLPKGMHVKNLLWLNADSDLYFSFYQGLTALPNRTITEEEETYEGIALDSLIETAGLTGYETYTFTSTDGMTVDITADMLAEGIMCLNNRKDTIRIRFAGAPKSMNLKYVYTVEGK